MINYKNGRKWRESQNNLIEKSVLRGKNIWNQKQNIISELNIVWITK